MIGVLVLIITAIISYKGFKDMVFFANYKFNVDKILIGKEYKRLVTSGFLHVNWSHLILNIISLYLFSNHLENTIGVFYLLLIYIISLIGGNLLALFIHKNHGNYTAVGASGAVSGVIFASIALFPSMRIGFLLLPFSIPSWLFGILYMAYSIYGIKSSNDTIGHEAHLGGALTGILVAIFIHPNILHDNSLTIAAIVVPTLLFLYLIITKPHLLFINTSSFKIAKTYQTIDDKYNDKRISRQQELDKLLDKIAKKGIKGLSKKERKKLEEYSK